MTLPEPTVLSVTPSRRKYTHRNLCTVIDRQGMDERGTIIDDVPGYARNADPTIFVCLDPADFLAQLEERYGNHPGWNFKFIRSGDKEEDGRMERVRLDRFGWYPKHEFKQRKKDDRCTCGRPERHTIHSAPYENGRRKQAMHMVWAPGYMAPTPSATFLSDGTHVALMEWATDFREFHHENDIPLATTFAGVASRFLRHPRFYPEPRRRVPTATNERARDYLAGVHQEFRGSYSRNYPDAYSLDQSRAYHRIAQEIPLPASDYLHARGYFVSPFDATDFWAVPGDEIYCRTINQPGIVFVQAIQSRTGKGIPYRLPTQDFYGRKKLALWTNEIELAESLGLRIEGIYAALTALTEDEGMKRYGKWAERQINASSPERRQWLKPTLHAAYGLLGARPRALKFGYRNSERGEIRDYLFGAHQYSVHHVETRGKLQPPIANVPMLGVLQAEVRKRTITLANDLMAHGVEVMHIHADGLHARGQLPLDLPPNWTVEPATNLRYVDSVSWISDEVEHLPGRAKDSIERWRIRVGLSNQGARRSRR